MTPKPSDFEKFLLTEYFRLGSINRVYTAHRHNLPISFASYARLLSKFHIIKSAGPNSRLSESLDILSKLSSYKIPLEKIYHHFAPKSIRVSINTLHRILHYTRLGLTRRQGTALLITSPDFPSCFLTGRETKNPNSQLGKKGDLAIPMGHSKLGESPQDAITRVLQQEVFTQQTITGNFPWKLIPEHPKPAMFINIADIKVAVYHLTLLVELPFSSYKLGRLKFRPMAAIEEQSTRPGVSEICQKFQNQKTKVDQNSLVAFNSNLNLALAKTENK